MNRGIGIILLVLFVFTSCKKETLSQFSHQTGANVELRFEAFNTRETALPEDVVNRVRIVIFGSEGSTDKGVLLCNHFAYPDQSGLIAPIIVSDGVRDIYFIINEPLGQGNNQLVDFENLSTVSDIAKLELLYSTPVGDTPYSPTEITMFSHHPNTNLYGNSYNITKTELERVMAKVTLNLNVLNSNFTQGKEPVITSITVKNLPPKSYFVSKPYSGPLTDSEVQVPILVTTTASYDYSYSNTFYVPEYILNDINDGAYLEIKGHIKGESKVVKWIVKIGDAMDSAGRYGTRYNITRNRHYTFTGNVKSIGSSDDLDVKVVVSPWNSVDIDGDVGEEVLTINKRSADVYLDRVNRSIFIGRESGLSLSDVDPATLFSAITYTGEITSAQQGLVLGVERRDDNTLWITIKNIAADQYTGEGVAKFDIQFGPYKHTISVIFPDIIGFFGDAPDMGNLKGDGTMYSSLLAVSLVEQSGYGSYKVDRSENDFEISSIYYGKEMNIAAAALPNLAAYTAFNYCIGLNKDVNGNKIIDRDEMVWYLPSQNQLMTMYVFNAGLNLPPFTNDENERGYWCSTQCLPPLSPGFAIFMRLSDGYMYGAEKDFPFYARCVRDIMPNAAQPY